jgi:excisionase family DNA binding protein
VHDLEMYTFNEYIPESYTPEQAAQLMRVKTSTIYAWISRGELQANKAGFSRSISKQQLKRFIENRQSGKYAFALEHIR